MRLQRTVLTSADPGRVFDYLSDFTTTTEWDPGTVTTTRISGDGGVGTTYRNVSRFLGRESTLTYTVTDVDAPHHVVLRGENATVIAIDSIHVRPDGAATRVTYRADFTFKGLARLAGPLLRPALTRLGDEAERGLAEALGRLAVDS